MPRKLFMCFVFFFASTLLTHAQLIENFNDGNFTATPVWIGNTNDWIINAAGQLQSSNTVANSSFYLSTASTLATNAQWEFYVDLKFATSGTNYADVYLTASASDIKAIGTSGYFVRIGNTTDEISLYRKDAGVAAGIKIIDGVNGSVSSTTNNQVKIKVVRNAANQWILQRDLTGTGTSYFTEGNRIDATYLTAAYFGILVKQSTVATFAQKHFFDDIEIKAYLPDVIPPTIKTITVITANTLDVLFSEPLDNTTSQQATNYSVNNSIGTPVSAAQDVTNTALVHLTCSNTFPSGTNCQLTVNGVKDIAGNAITNGIATFTYFAPYTAAQYDVVIDEIMASPTPQVALPNNEWIELRNTSANAINLLGWRISSTTGISGGMPDFILKPDSFLVVCAGSAVAAMSAFGTTIPVTNFPSMDNDAGTISLISAQGKTIHAVGYSSTWYQSELKKSGGWSLEMIDTKNPCSGISNWKASTDLRGGSPGSKNGVDAINTDQSAPKLIRANAIDSAHISLLFDEPLDSLKATSIANYSISDGIGVPLAAIAVAPLFNTVNIKLSTPLVAGKVYTIIATAITDCAGNTIGNKNSTRVGLSAVADSLDIVINEILYNPPANGADYIEMYNRSNKIINLKQTYIANRGSNGTISNIVPISATNYLLFPQDYMVLTSDIAAVKATFIAQNVDGFIAVKLPSYNIDKGDIIILNAQGNITDEVAYTDSWQFKLLADTKGVALERIDYNGKSQSADNWHSAATSAGYGTPTYKNSQYRTDEQVSGEIKITPEIVSPDNDGQDDYASINYSFTEPGFIASITIFDARGRLVRNLQHNALCGTIGSFRWDGLGEKNQPLATGIYIIYSTVFNLAGKIKKFKTPIVVARRN